MQRNRASILATSLLVLGLALVSDVASAKPKPKAKSIAPSEVVEFEIHASSGTDSRTLTVPLHGDIAGWVDLFGDSRLCQAKSTPTRDELLVLELECRIDDRSRPVFELHGERGLVVDRPTLLGELEVGEGKRIRVIATRR
ncbi:hypothetical protein ACNOYE_18935 [Nannocystaceae bacterium ST9]